MSALQTKPHWREVSSALGNIGLFLGSMIIAVVGYTFVSTVNNLSDDIEEVRHDVKQLLQNDASNKSTINDLQRRIQRNEDNIDKLKSSI